MSVVIHKPFRATTVSEQSVHQYPRIWARFRLALDAGRQHWADHGFAALSSQCAVCREWPSQPLCEACVARFAQPCARCKCCAASVPPGVTECGDCVTHRPPWDACLAAVPYAYPWSGLISDFKFHGQPSWARPLALLMRSTPFVEPALEQANLILPMPLSRQRLRERGYNQAWQLARHLVPGASRKAAGKLRPDLLLRILDTTPQAGLKRSERLRNLTAAFAVDPLQSAALVAQRVVLVDDVMTSGATLHAACLALRAAGVAHITCIVLARTDPPA